MKIFSIISFPAKSRMLRLAFLLCFLIFVNERSVNAQPNLLMFDAQSIPQTSFNHPSYLPKARYYFGMPISSSNNFMYANNAFSYHDLVHKRSDDSLVIDIDKVYGQFHKNNFISLNFQCELLTWGFYVKNNYFNFDVTERANLYFSFSGDLMNLIYKGNGPYIGQTLDFSKTGFDVSHFRQYAAGMARQILPNLSGGIRFKYLYGMENFSTTRGKFSMYTAADDYHLVINSGVEVNTSSTLNTDDDVKVSKYLFGLGNRGYAFDLGSDYKYNDKWTFSFSLVDLGAIKWKAYVKRYRVPEGSYTFNGVDLKKFLNSDSSGSAQEVLDSLSNAFDTEESNESYSAPLPGRLYLNGKYKINEKSFASALIYSMFFKGTRQSAVMLSYHRMAGKHFELGAGWSYINHTFDNLGILIALNAGAFQYYIHSDNILGTLSPTNFRTTQTHFGINFRFQREGPKGAVAETSAN